ncbi:MAG: ABC transporter permease subunit, partial [Clostridia bacterium]|nr:ABC transporter permease subunit [Clostridia bacterium]
METTKFFSRPLIKQTNKSNLALTIAVLVISCLICFVLSFAMSILSAEESEELDEAVAEFYGGLSVLAANELSYDEFYAALMSGADMSAFAEYFEGADVTLEQFINSFSVIEGSDVELSAYVEYFEYTWALAEQNGVFSGESLSVNGAMYAMLGLLGIDPDLITTMSNMDPTAMVDSMYYHMVGILPILIWIVVVGNSVIASQVDRGSMAYVLSTPTKRSAVAMTQALYMVIVPLIMTVIVCVVKIICNVGFLGAADAGVTVVMYLGMYILIEALCGICYLGSCLFNRSSHSIAFGGTFVVWFFLASLIGMFGSDMMVDAGMGVESLNAFNYLTLITLFDVDRAATVGT